MLNGFSQQAIGGNVPNRLYNGLPMTGGAHLPISTLGAGIATEVSNSLTHTPEADNLTYSPGIVETSGPLAQVQIFNPQTGAKIPNQMRVRNNAAGNPFLRFAYSIF